MAARRKAPGPIVTARVFVTCFGGGMALAVTVSSSVWPLAAAGRRSSMSMLARGPGNSCPASVIQVFGLENRMEGVTTNAPAASAGGTL